MGSFLGPLILWFYGFDLGDLLAAIATGSGVCRPPDHRANS